MVGIGEGATLIKSFPVPRMNPASVLPMPVANCPKAPALHVCESVPNNTSPEDTDQQVSFPHLCNCEECAYVRQHPASKLEAAQ